MAINQLPISAPDQPCSCSGPSPTFSPRFESLSDDDLDALELIYWAIFNQTTQPSELPTYEGIQALFAPCACWTCISPRKRRELLISQMLDVSACMSASEIRAIIGIIETKSTRDQRKAALDCARYQGIQTMNCGNLLPS